MCNCSFRRSQRHSNASQSLCEIIRLSRDQLLQVQNSPEPDPLLATLEKYVSLALYVVILNIVLCVYLLEACLNGE